MQVSHALVLKSTRRFKEATKSNMGEWFREFLRANPPKKLTKGNHLAPLKEFMKLIKNSLRTLRPEGASGVESGKWRLPCGLTAKKAWAFLEKQFAQLRANMMPAMKDAAPKQPSCKGRFQIVPAEQNSPTELVHRRRREPKSTTWENVNGCLMPILDPASFIRRPRDPNWRTDQPKTAAPTKRREKRGQSKPNARCP